MLLIILVQGFCLLKIDITQFPDGFRLNHFNSGWSLSQNQVKRSLSFTIYSAWLLVFLVIQ